MKNQLIALVACLVLFAACKKKDDPSRATLLTSGKWKATGLKASANFLGQDTSFDLLALQMPCMLDNYTIFQADNTVITDEGQTTCVPGTAQQTNAGTWALTNGDANLVLSGGATAGAYSITTLDGATLVLQRDSTLNFPVNGFNVPVPLKIVATFSHVD